MAKSRFEPFLAPVSAASNLLVIKEWIDGLFWGVLCDYVSKPWKCFPPRLQIHVCSGVAEVMRLANLPHRVVSVASQPWALKPWHHFHILPLLAGQPHFLPPHDLCSWTELENHSDRRGGLQLTSLVTGPAFSHPGFCQSCLAKSQIRLYNSLRNNFQWLPRVRRAMSKLISCLMQMVPWN